MKTKTIVKAGWTGFRPFEIPNMLNIPRKDEHFEIDKTAHPIQATIAGLASEFTGQACRVNYVKHRVRENTHTIIIYLYCGK